MKGFHLSFPLVKCTAHVNGDNALRLKECHLAPTLKNLVNMSMFTLELYLNNIPSGVKFPYLNIN